MYSMRIYNVLEENRKEVDLVDKKKNDQVERAERIAKLIALIQDGISDYDLGYIQGRFENKCRTLA